MPALRLLVLHRPSGPRGGDDKAAKYYAEAMAGLGVEVTIRPANELENLQAFDFVHMWAAVSPDWGMPAAYHVRRADVPLIVTPFYWPRDKRLAFYGDTADLYPGYKQQIGSVLHMADVWACVTLSEIKNCWELAPHHNAFVQGMGFTPLPFEAEDPEDYVLCVGRVEKHKNQASLARACAHLGYRLECVGPIVDREYALEVAAWGGNLHGELDDTDWRHILARARVCALPSFGETVATVNAEALSLGIPTVTSIDTADYEFFGLHAAYCTPSDWRDIAQTLDMAWKIGRQAPLQLPTWEEAARRTLNWMEQYER